MTREEITGERDLYFSGWIRENLPDSDTGYLVSDLDFILWNHKTRNLMLIEVKTRNSTLRFWQEGLFNLLDKLIITGIKHINPPITYYGFHTVGFEKTCFEDGKCYFDHYIIDEKELIKKLSME